MTRVAHASEKWGRLMLEQFLRDNRDELIQRTRRKVAGRPSPPVDPSELEHGVPLFLSQLSTALADQGTGGTEDSLGASHSAKPAISASAARHGLDLLKFGFTIEQVVHDYGDVCQAVTELAEERCATLSVVEFQTLNQCLDNAIAGAVTSWSDERYRTRAHSSGASDLSQAAFTGDIGALLDTAIMAFDVVLGGKVAVGGSTGMLLRRTLAEARARIDKVEAP